MANFLADGALYLNALNTISESFIAEIGDTQNVSGIWIRSFEDREQGIVTNAGWLSRTFDRMVAFFSQKKVVPYSLQDNFNYIKDLLDKCAVPQDNDRNAYSLDKEIRLIKNLDILSDILERFSTKKKLDQTILNAIKTKLTQLQDGLKDDFIKKCDSKAIKAEGKDIEAAFDYQKASGAKGRVDELKKYFTEIPLQEQVKEAEKVLSKDKTSQKRLENQLTVLAQVPESFSDIKKVKDLQRGFELRLEVEKLKSSADDEKSREKIDVRCLEKYESLKDSHKDLLAVGHRYLDFLKIRSEYREIADRVGSEQGTAQEIYDTTMKDFEGLCRIERECMKQLHGRGKGVEGLYDKVLYSLKKTKATCLQAQEIAIKDLFAKSSFYTFDQIEGNIEKAQSFQDLQVPLFKLSIDSLQMKRTIKDLEKEKKVPAAQELMNKFTEKLEDMTDLVIDKIQYCSLFHRRNIQELLDSQSDIKDILKPLCEYEANIRMLKEFANKFPQGTAGDEHMRSLKEEITEAELFVRKVGESIKNKFAKQVEEAKKDEPVKEQGQKQELHVHAFFVWGNISQAGRDVNNITNQAGGGSILADILPSAMLAAAGGGGLGVLGPIGSLLCISAGAANMLTTASKTNIFALMNLPRLIPAAVTTGYYLFQGDYTSALYTTASAIALPAASYFIANQMGKALPESVRSNPLAQGVLQCAVQLALIKGGESCLSMLQSDFENIPTSGLEIEPSKQIPVSSETEPLTDMWLNRTPTGLQEPLTRVTDMSSMVSKDISSSFVNPDQTPVGAFETTGQPLGELQMPIDVNTMLFPKVEGGHTFYSTAMAVMGVFLQMETVEWQNTKGF